MIFRGHDNWAGESVPALLLQPCCNPREFPSRGASERRFHRVGGGVLHIGEYVRVGIEGDGYGGVAEHLRDNLRVDAFPEQQRGARVPRS